jgi:hypothetical protein
MPLVQRMIADRRFGGAMGPLRRAKPIRRVLLSGWRRADAEFAADHCDALRGRTFQSRYPQANFNAPLSDRHALSLHQSEGVSVALFGASA